MKKIIIFFVLFLIINPQIILSQENSQFKTGEDAYIPNDNNIPVKKFKIEIEVENGAIYKVFGIKHNENNTVDLSEYQLMDFNRINCNNSNIYQDKRNSKNRCEVFFKRNSKSYLIKVIKE